MDQSTKGLKELLGQTQLKDLLQSKQEKPLVGVAHTVDVGTVLDTLSKYSVLSAPIFVSEQGSQRLPPLSALLLGLWMCGLCCQPSYIRCHLKQVRALSLVTFHHEADSNGGLSAEQLEQLGAALCARPVLSLFGSSAAGPAAADVGDAKAACADWELHGAASCRAPPTPASAAGSRAQASPCPRHHACPQAPSQRGGSGGSNNGTSTGDGRHPAAAHRIMVATPGDAQRPLSVLSQSDVLRFLAAHHECLRPLGKASLAELGLATGSLLLAAGPAGTGMGSGTCRPPPLFTGSPAAGHGHGGALPHIPSSPKPPLAGGGSYGSSGGGLLGSLSGMSASPAQESYFPAASMLQRASSGPTAVQMSPPPSPRVSAACHAAASLGSPGPAAHRPAPRRQLVAVHESVTALEAFRVLLQQRVSAVAVLAGAGSSANMRLVGNLSASDLRHLRRGGFGVLALSVKQFLASKPLAPDQAIPMNGPARSPEPSPPAAAAAAASPAAAEAAPPKPGPPPRAHVLMAHAPGAYTCQATASLEELVRMLGAPQHGIHRVYVVDPDQRPAGVVTATDVLQLLSTACSRE
ncbi:hypothetical protein COO60DRAFT_1627468 [Scenedesmus sp. NREL 46B-D3]|nr:hypothetical protein COO60DRAFT_1627468 [Scenedesmus sp. NREL 46B-D3]